MNKLIILIILTTFFGCQENPVNESSSKNNTKLKRQLEQIYIRDQGIRQIIQEKLEDEDRINILNQMNLPSEYLSENDFLIMNKIDSLNLIEVENIIKIYGYPGRDLVGDTLNETVFYVIQHSKKIEEYLPLIRKAAFNEDVPMNKLAMMEDRYLMDNGKEQIYGTQIRGQKNKEGKWIDFIWPIKNPDSINIIRNKIGLENIEDYAKKFDIEYKVLTLEEIEDL